MKKLNTTPAIPIIADSGYGPVRIKETIARYAVIPAGTILGRVTATGKMVPYDALNYDGSELPKAVLLENVDTTACDVEALVGFAGVYVESNISGLDAAGKDFLEARGLYFK